MFNNPGWALLLILVALGLLGWSRWRGFRHRWAAFMQWEKAGSPAPAEPALPIVESAPASLALAVDATPLEGAGPALATPPGDLGITLAYIEQNYPGRHYTFPLGWYATGGEAHCVVANLIDDVYHMLISAQSRIGKDVLASNIMLGLAATYTPRELQFCIVDGKGLDWIAWERKAHCWRVAPEPEDIKDAMEALTEERRSRKKILQAAGVRSWEEYQAKGGELPLLVVYVSELLLLENATSKSELTTWLNAELTAAAAFGLRYIISTQNAANFSTQWRGQISLFMAGYQASRYADEPNTGLSTTDLRQAGAIPPSELPGNPIKGTFTAVQGRQAQTVRVGYMDPAQYDRRLAALPDKPLQQPARPVERAAQPALQQQPATPAATADPVLNALLNGQSFAFDDGAPVVRVLAASKQDLNTSPTISNTGGALEKSRVAHPPAELLLSTEDVPAEEQRRILAAARTAPSRGELCKALYGSRGGPSYTWVRQVCDAAGLLMPQAQAQKQAA